MNINPEIIVNTMKVLWTFSEQNILKIATHFQSFDETFLYLELMDSECEDSPKKVWKLFCELNDIEHEIPNNPF